MYRVILSHFPSVNGHFIYCYLLFIKELAKLMTLDRGKTAQLSVIIDQHWDKLKFRMREDANGY